MRICPCARTFKGGATIHGRGRSSARPDAPYPYELHYAVVSDDFPLVRATLTLPTWRAFSGHSTYLEWPARLLPRQAM